jgi:TonB-linked SusC/RagA family outer membrane protein
MKRLAFTCLKISLIMAILLNTVDALAQKEIRGTVSDATESNPIQGATVSEKNTKNTVSTDGRGRFKIKVSGPNSILVFSNVGYETSERTVNSATTINMSLLPEAKQLGDVVVIGYGAVKKRDLTGAVSSLKVTETDKTGMSSVEDLMRGRIAGVQIAGDNTPGSASSIRIRGGTSIYASNEPLYVVDGFPILNSSVSSDRSDAPNSESPISDIDPNNIESVEVLKDASATAIYGSRGANGVILITTKKGAAGKTNFTVKSSTGVTKVVNNYPAMDSYQFAMYERSQNFRYPYDTPPIDTTTFAGRSFYLDDFKNLPSTNWIDQITRLGSYKEFYAGLSGGTKQTRYAGSIGYNNTKGIIKYTGNNRLTGNFSLDSKVTNFLEFGISTNLAYNDLSGVVTSNNPDVVTSEGALVNALAFYPFLSSNTSETIYQQNGLYLLTNPIANVRDIDKNTFYLRATMNAYLKINILPNLNIKSMVSGRYDGRKYKSFAPSTTALGLPFGGKGEIDNFTSLDRLIENTLNYSLVRGNHHIDAVAGMTAQKNHSEDHYQSSNLFSNQILGYNNLGAATNNAPPVTSASEWQLASFLGRVNYSYKDKYLLTASLRADGSSRMAADHKWGYFPAVAAAWRISDEDFMKGIDWLSGLKLRLGYGVTGNQSVPLYSSLSLMTTGNAYIYPNDVPKVGLRSTRLANSDLKWETTSQTNIGVDLSVIQGRVSLTADYYYKKTTDLLLNMPIPSAAGFNSIMKNAGSVENRGFEIDLSTVNLTGPLEWRTSFNLAANKNKILDLGGRGNILVGKSSYQAIIMAGAPLGSWYGYQSDGIWTQDDLTYTRSAGGVATYTVVPGHEHAQVPGEVLTYGLRKYKDINNDGVINDNDRSIIGRSQPKFFGGITNSFSYHGFSLSFFLEYSYGRQLFDMTRSNFVDATGGYNHFAVDRYYPTVYALVPDGNGNLVEDRNQVLEPGNPNGKYPLFSQGGLGGWTIDQFVEDGSYIRMKDLTISYSLPSHSHLLNAMKMSQCQVWIRASNLFTITSYPGNDPAINSDGASNSGGAGLLSGKDWSSYPLYKTYAIGINLNF